MLVARVDECLESLEGESARVEKSREKYETSKKAFRMRVGEEDFMKITIG